MAGKAIVLEFKHLFKDVLTHVWNKETATTQQNEGATVKGLVGKNVTLDCNGSMHQAEEAVDRERLLQGYKDYEEEFKRNFTRWHAGELDLERLVAEAQEKSRALRPCQVTAWGEALKNQLPQLLGLIFAYFTISKSGESYRRFEKAEEEGTTPHVGGEELKLDTMLQKAHNVQVIAILRLFAYDIPGTSQLRNNLLQIRTGEGKSMILGACSILFALLGFRVRCVCYSDYLSQRDYGLFEDLFEAFGVKGEIVYSKITAYSEDSVAQRGDIRELTKKLIHGTLGKELESRLAVCQPQQKEILLVDEVDVFFGQEFHGQTYNIIAQIELNEVQRILRKIWEHHDHARSPRRLFQIMQASSEYTGLLAKFPQWQTLIATEVQAMCQDLQHFEEPKYHYDAQSDRIFYTVMDCPCYDVVYGYRTAFAYLKSSTVNSADGLRRALQLRISCGQFSYANIDPACILGVSGTLAALGGYEWSIMAKYGLKSWSLIPSVYPPSEFTFLEKDKAIVVADDLDRFHQQITQEVRSKTGDERAVIVFFKDPEALEMYNNSSYVRAIAMKKEVLLERDSHSEKESKIKRAASTGQVTLTTAAFGRGTDFVCTDKRLCEKGGVHVIQTFLASNLSEEMQIKGRTARQGQKGSYSLVLLSEEIGITSEAAQKEIQKDLYERIQKKIRERCVTECEARDESLHMAEDRDKLSHQYLTELLAGNAEAAEEKLKLIHEQLHKPVKVLKKVRIIILSDATGSMGSLWSSTKAEVRKMLQRVEDVGGNSLQLKWVAYRDYSDEYCLQDSPWTHEPHILQHFVDGIATGGGDDTEEAIEKALQFAREEHIKVPLDRILLLGDAPPHKERKGERLESHNRIMETDYRLESEALQALGVPVYAFRIGTSSATKETFQEIATITEGQFADLNPENLVDAVCMSALDEIGGSELVAEYMARYKS